MNYFSLPEGHPHRKLSKPELRALGYEFENDNRDYAHASLRGRTRTALTVIASAAKPVAPMLFSAAPVPASVSTEAPAAVATRRTLASVLASVRAVVSNGVTYYSAGDLWRACGFASKHAARDIGRRIGETLIAKHLFPGPFDFTPAYALTLPQVHAVALSLGIEVPAPEAAQEPAQAPNVNAEALALLARIEIDTAALRALLTRP